MARQVTVVANQIQLANGYTYKAGDVVVLTDQQFSLEAQAVTDGQLTDNGPLPDAAHRVTVNMNNVQLPNGHTFQSGAVVYLSMEDFAKLGDAEFTDGTLTDGGVVLLSTGGLAFATVPFSATPAFNGTTGVSMITLTGNVTSSTLTGGVAGYTTTLIFKQDGTGGRTVVLPTNLHFGGAAPTPVTTANTVNVYEAVYDGTSWIVIGSAMGAAA